jgi:N-acetylmuramic acid 6-phosphate etherase
MDGRLALAEELDRLATEGARPGLVNLDRLPAAEIVGLLLAAEREAQQAVARAAPRIAQAVEAIAERMSRGGRLFYLGAGTPGRLAALDAAELGPTFSVPPGTVIALMAGGPAALTQAVEGAEDDAEAAARDLAGHGLTAQDSVVGITASGRTPYVLGGLRRARAVGAATVAVVNNQSSPAAALADIALELLTGPEVLAGSTRLSAGTAQKIVLNTLSTSVMVRLGKTFGPWMVDLDATNTKLRRRALRIVCDVTGAALREAGGRVKPAIVAILAGIGVAEAAQRLRRANGRVRDALGQE